MIVAISVHDESTDVGDYYIGSACVPEVNGKPIYTSDDGFLDKRTPDGKPVNVHNVVDDLWSEWRKEVEHPDTDSEFIDWLVKEHGWTIPDEEPISHTITN